MCDFTSLSFSLFLPVSVWCLFPFGAGCCRTSDHDFSDSGPSGFGPSQLGFAVPRGRHLSFSSAPAAYIRIAFTDSRNGTHTEQRSQKQESTLAQKIQDLKHTTKQHSTNIGPNQVNPLGSTMGFSSVVSSGPMHVEDKIAPLPASSLESRDSLCTA